MPNHESSAQIRQYIDLLLKWNKAYNLTAITDPDEIASKHIADSLIISPFLNGNKIIDIGTGAGLPGIPLAIVNPDKHFTLLDSNGKKIRFLKHVKQQLGLNNVTPVQARVEQFQPEQCFSSVLSRAFASICDMLRGSEHLACADGRFLAMKGAEPTEELEQLPAGFTLEHIHPLSVTGLRAERCLVEIKKSND